MSDDLDLTRLTRRLRLQGHERAQPARWRPSADIYPHASGRLRKEFPSQAENETSMRDEVWFADTQGRFTLANPAALQELATDLPIDVEALAAGLEVFWADGSPRPIEASPPLRALNGEHLINAEEISLERAVGRSSGCVPRVVATSEGVGCGATLMLSVRLAPCAQSALGAL